MMARVVQTHTRTTLRTSNFPQWCLEWWKQQRRSPQPPRPSPPPRPRGGFYEDAHTALEERHRRREEIANGDGGVPHSATTIRGVFGRQLRRAWPYTAIVRKPGHKWRKPGVPSGDIAASATVALGRYGPEDALLMCEYWVEKVAFLFFFNQHEGMDFTFTDVILASVPEKPAFQALRTGAVGHTARCVQELLALRPMKAP